MKMFSRISFFYFTFSILFYSFVRDRSAFMHYFKEGHDTCYITAIIGKSPVFVDQDQDDKLKAVK